MSSSVEKKTRLFFFFLIIYPQLSGSICGSVFWMVHHPAADHPHRYRDAFGKSEISSQLGLLGKRTRTTMKRWDRTSLLPAGTFTPPLLLLSLIALSFRSTC